MPLEALNSPIVEYVYFFTLMSEVLLDLAGKSILLVEDNPINQKVTERFLSRWGAKVVIAVNGKEALVCLENNAFNLVLMDIQMPIMDGFACTAAIRASENLEVANLPILALTADNSQETAQAVLKAGMNDALSKPFKPEHLGQKIIGLLEQ